MSEIKIKFNGTELTEFDGELGKLIMSPGDEEEGKCPYCERTGLKYTRSTPDSNLGFRIDGNELSICLCERDGQRVLSKFKINYCPMCRRKLEE